MSLSLTTLPHRFYRLLGIERRRRPRRRHPVTLAQSRIYILPTAAGLGYASLVLLLLVGATNYASGPLFMLTFLLAATGFTSLFHCYRNLAGLTFLPGPGSRCFAGQAALCSIQADNPSDRPRAALEIGLGHRPSSVSTTIRPGRSTIDLTVPTERRGRLPMPALTVATRYPLGLFRAWSHIHIDAEIIVYPKPLDIDRPPPAYHDGHPDAPRPGGDGQDDFVGHRDHQPTDSPRHVDWKAVARGRPMMTKLFAANGEETVLIDWDAADGDVERRLGQLCRWLLMAEAGSRDYALRLPGQTLPAARGEAHKHRCLTALAVYDDPERR